MRKACRRNTVFLFAAAILTGLLSGCASDNGTTMTLGEWITLLDQKAGLSADPSSKPYFMNVTEDSPYYEAVQAAAEWSVLDGSAPFEPEQVLTREWTAYTLMNLSERDIPEDFGIEIRDLSASAFPKHVAASVAGGLLSLDSKGRFRPRQAIEKTEALNCLAAVTDLIDSGRIEMPHSEIAFNEDLEFIEELPEEIDEETGTAVFPAGTPASSGQYFRTDDNQPQLYRITGTETADDAVYAAIEPAKAEDVISDIDAADSFTVDFSTARIVDLADQTVIQEGTLATNDTAVPAGVRQIGYARSHDINGYHISYSVTATGIRAEVTKKTPSGLNVFGNLTVSSVTPSYRWKMEDGVIKDGYFKMEFTSSENLGAEAGSYKKLYGDFSRVEPGNFLGTIRNLFQAKNDAADITLPLVSVEIPVPSSPLLTIGMQLQLTIRASGRAQLSLTQDNRIGMELRDGHVRGLNHSDMKAEAELRADTGLLGGVSSSMKLAGMALADITAEAGVTAKADAVVHLYDSENNHSVVKAEDIPSDLIDDLADGNEGVLTCADISAYKTMDIKLNSSRTLAGRAGLGKTITLSNEQNGELIPGLNGHMENGHYVSRCTRKDRIQTNETEVVESDDIRIGSYSLIADPGEKIEIPIKALPAGYQMSDLVFSSDTPSVASVSGTDVTAVKEGAAIIHIRTKDGKYEVSCSVLVRHKA